MCGINLRLAKIENFVKKERDQSNMCGINLRLARILNLMKERDIVKYMRNKSKVS